MAAMLLVAVVFILLFLYITSSQNGSKNQREPPGPKPLPLLGNVIQLDLNRLHLDLLDLSKKYGPVFTIHLGCSKAVVLAGFKTIKQAFVNHAEEFGNRYGSQIFHDYTKGNGVIFTNGETWTNMRRFVLSTLKNYGMGKRIIEEKIIEECNYLVEEFEKHKGSAFDSSHVMHCAASNIISSVIFGQRFEYNDTALEEMVARNSEIIQLAGSGVIQVYNIFPWLGSFLKTYKHLMKLVDHDVENFRHIIKGLEETLNPQMPRCLTDSFLIQKHILEESGVMDSQFHEDNLIHTVRDLFAAGTDTTGNTLSWSLLFMAKYPHHQDLVQEELSSTIGSRQVRVEDRKNLPYTDAVIHESQRLANVAPISIPHMTSQDITFQGYFIKKGTPVIPLLTSVLNGETEWENPHTFSPSHFLDKEGKFVSREAFIPFSAGRRACPGESLARMELFLFFTTLLQRFRFTPPPGVTEEELDLTPVIGFTLSPKPQNLCVFDNKTRQDMF